MQAATDAGVGAPRDRASWRLVAWETLFILGVFFIHAGSAPPAANEAHYFAKARHYWAPSWCPHDAFLNSADAHCVFYWTFGWLSAVWPLPVAAWVSRLTIWTLLAVAWRRLSWEILPRRYVSVWTAALLLLGIDQFHLAGEWLVGGAEAKGMAYVFVLWALGALVRGRWASVWLLLGLASAFHVLVGGWSVVALGLCWLLAGDERPAARRQIMPALGGLLLALPGLVPVLLMSSDADPETLALANRIYVFQRLAHHLTVSGMAAERIARFGVLLMLWAVLWPMARHNVRWRRLNRFALAAVAIAAAGALLELALSMHPDAAAAVLRFYWFRLADVLVPLSVALAVPVVLWRAGRPAARPPAAARWWRGIWALAVLLPGVFLVGRFAEHRRDPRPQAEVQSRPLGRARPSFRRRHWRAWQDVCHWIRTHTPADTRVLTPRNQQTFKWYAQRSEVVSWKDIPQDARSIVRWWRTLQDVYPPHVAATGLSALSDQELSELAHRYEARYVLIDRSRSRRRLGFRRVYPQRWTWQPIFELYEVPAP